MDPDDEATGTLAQSQLDDLAALRQAAERRRALPPGSDEHQAALDEERTIAKRIRVWASVRPAGDETSSTDGSRP